MDVHVYKDRKYVRTLRNVKFGDVVDYEDDPHQFVMAAYDGEDPMNPKLPPTKWPEGAEL